jgi:trimethylamine--corrinoid protein Co-methyltransferase
VLSEGDLERLAAATLALLEGPGVEIGVGAVLERLGAAGARIDAETGRVRFPGSLVEDALGMAPRELLLAARDPSCDLRVDGTAGWLSTGGRASEIIDPESGDRRPSTGADLARATRLADAVPQVGLVGTAVAALDVSASVRTLHELRVQIANTSKHVQLTTVIDARDARAAVEIGRIVAGGDREFRGRPIVSALLRSRSPLAYERRVLDAAVAFAEAGMPCGFVATPVSGIASPVGGVGSLVAADAEVLAGVVALRLLVPGAPTFYGTCARTTDGTGTGSTDPDDLFFLMASAELAHRRGLPVRVGAFVTAAKAPDWQAGLAGGLSSFCSWLAGADVLGDAGSLGGGRVFSAAGMLLDTELFDLVRQIPLGFEVDEETLAVEVIEKVGPAQHFLGEPHTIRHMREAWMARFMNRDTWEAWEEAGRPEPPSHAAERAAELLDSHEPEPLAPGVEERIREVIAEHERDAAS